MSQSPPEPQAQSAAEGHERFLPLTRRTVLAGAAAATAAVTIGVEPALAQKAFSADMVAFLNLSSALTGIAPDKLGPVTDSLELKQEYFQWIRNQTPQAAPFAALLQIADPSNGASHQAIIEKSQANNDTKFLARSIVLLWYLGSWYEPAALKSLVDAELEKKKLFITHTVVSPKAYTQGWLWRVIQAHPMGYSDMQFGYWARRPEPLEDFISRTSSKPPLPPKPKGA